MHTSPERLACDYAPEKLVGRPDKGNEAYTYECMFMRIYVHMYVYTYICMYIRVYVHICM
jgi:hypothetical protein